MNALVIEKSGRVSGDVFSSGPKESIFIKLESSQRKKVLFVLFEMPGRHWKFPGTIEGVNIMN